MIDSKNILRLLKELDDYLFDRSAPRALVIYGGAALISMGITQRATVDIDVFQPKLDPILSEGIRFIAKKYLFDEHWINSTGNAFVKELPEGWRSRTVEYFKGRSLTISTLGRTDMIFTKLLAELDRQEDMQDLKQLKPTKDELNFIRMPLLSLEDSSEWRSKVREILNELSDVT